MNSSYPLPSGSTATRFLRGAGACLLAASLPLFSSGCGSRAPGAGAPEGSSATVTGLVIDTTGTAVAGVAVGAAGVSTATGADGRFSLSVPPRASVVVSFSKAGYLDSAKVAAATAGTTAYVVAAVAPMAAPQPLDATNGGTVTGARGAALTAGPSAFVDPSGNVVTGTVEVSLTPLGPGHAGELAAYPGSLVATTDAGVPAILETFGVLDVTVTQNGTALQVAPGQTVTATIPVTPDPSLAMTQDLWRFDPSTATWDSEGTAQLAGSAYRAQLGHLSFHNIDEPIFSNQASCVTGRVVDAAGNPVKGAYVSPEQGSLYDDLLTTGSDGSYCTWVLPGQTETITADATSAPYGEGSVSVTGGAPIAISFEDFLACPATCTSAPDIVLSQPACTQNTDCASPDDVCCPVGGHGMCLEPIACSRASGQPYCGDGDAACFVEVQLGDGAPSADATGGRTGADASVTPADGSTDAPDVTPTEASAEILPLTDAGACFDLASGLLGQVGTVVPWTVGTAASATPTGGTLAAGTYVLTSEVWSDASCIDGQNGGQSGYVGFRGMARGQSGHGDERDDRARADLLGPSEPARVDPPHVRRGARIHHSGYVARAGSHGRLRRRDWSVRLRRTPLRRRPGERGARLGRERPGVPCRGPRRGVRRFSRKTAGSNRTRSRPRATRSRSSPRERLARRSRCSPSRCSGGPDPHGPLSPSPCALGVRCSNARTCANCRLHLRVRRRCRLRRWQRFVERSVRYASPASLQQLRRSAG